MKKIAFSLFFALSAATISFAGESQPSNTLKSAKSVVSETVINFEGKEYSAVSSKKEEAVFVSTPTKRLDLGQYCMNTSIQSKSGGIWSGTLCAASENAWYFKATVIRNM
jgi:hypothetical protein